MKSKKVNFCVIIIPDDVVMKAYTSGATTKPKAAKITGENLKALTRIKHLLRFIRQKHLGLTCNPAVSEFRVFNYYWLN